MPPKAALKRGCRVGKRATVPLEDISVNEDSGWRDVDEAEVDKFYQIILDGDYGNTTLKAPTVRAVNKDVVPDSDRNPQGRSASQFVFNPPMSCDISSRSQPPGARYPLKALLQFPLTFPPRLLSLVPPSGGLSQCSEPPRVVALRVSHAPAMCLPCLAPGVDPVP